MYAFTNSTSAQSIGGGFDETLPRASVRPIETRVLHTQATRVQLRQLETTWSAAHRRSQMAQLADAGRVDRPPFGRCGVARFQSHCRFILLKKKFV